MFFQCYNYCSLLLLLCGGMHAASANGVPSFLSSFFFIFFFFFKQQCDNDFELLFSSSILKDLSISRVLSIVPMSLLQNTRQHPGRRVSILELLASPTIW